MTRRAPAAPRVRAVDPRTDPDWLELSRGSTGSLFTSPPWISAVCDTYGFGPTARVLVGTDERPMAGLAWVDVRDLRGDRRLALPFCDRAEPIVGDQDEWTAVASDALAGDLPFTLRCLDASPAAADPRLTRTGEAAWHRTPLTPGPDLLHAAFRPQTRRNIAKADRSGVRVELRADAEAVEVLHSLHVGLRKRKYRLLAQPRDLFSRIWKAFAPDDAIRTGIASVDGVPVAAAMYLVWQDTVYYKFGASRADSLAVRPNDALHWQLIRWAAGRGLRALDWGLSDLDQPGLVAYKRNWASEEGRIATLNAGGGPLGRRADVENVLREMTALLTRPDVPAPVTERGGAVLYRYFC